MPLTVVNLGKDYPTRSGPLAVLRNVSLGVAAGEALCIMGPSGSGKSTLLNVVGTLDRPTAGGVRLDGVDPFALAEQALAAFRNERVGFVFQDHHLLPQCSVLENVLVPTFVNRAATPAEAEKAARGLLDRVGLSHRLEHLPSEISGGERQRAAVARALVLNPKLLLADEPTGNLDRTNAQAVGQLLAELARERNAVLVVVTHSPELAKLFPKRAEMNDGTLHLVG